MAEVFISYSSHDLERARALALALETEGWSVWWDRRILPGERFDKVIRDAVDEADCVIVLWSDSSIDSDFVKEEAELGKTRDRLLPVVIDEVPPPLGFGRIQTGSLVGWEGQRDHPGYSSLLVAIANKVAGSRTVAGAASNETGTSPADTIVVGRESEAGRIGRYETRRILGSGSFATVWLAYDPGLDAEVSVKVLAENWSLDPDIHRRFVEEARILRRLEHPSIIRVYDVGEHNGRPFFVMEYADRGSLLDRMQVRRMSGRPYDVAEAVAISERTAESLEVAHAHGVVHRDLKPSNVLFRSSEGWPDGERTMLADFGIARNLQAASGYTISAGTPHYAAPEQAEGQADERSDVHAAAAILYEMLSGTVPYPYPSIGQVLSVQKASGPPSITTTRSDTPTDLDDLLRDGLAVDPEQRVASAREWRSRLGCIDTATSDRSDAIVPTVGPMTAVTAADIAAGAAPDDAAAPEESAMEADEAPATVDPSATDIDPTAVPPPEARLDPEGEEDASIAETAAARTARDRPGVGEETIAESPRQPPADPETEADQSDWVPPAAAAPATSGIATVVAKPTRSQHRGLWFVAAAAIVLAVVAGVFLLMNRSDDGASPQTAGTTTNAAPEETRVTDPTSTASTSVATDAESSLAFLGSQVTQLEVLDHDDFSSLQTSSSPSGVGWELEFPAPDDVSESMLVEGIDGELSGFRRPDQTPDANPAVFYRFRALTLDSSTSNFHLTLAKGGDGTSGVTSASITSDSNAIPSFGGSNWGLPDLFREQPFPADAPVTLEAGVWYDALVAAPADGGIVFRVWRTDAPDGIAELRMATESGWIGGTEWAGGFHLYGADVSLEIDEYAFLDFDEIVPVTGSATAEGETQGEPLVRAWMPCSHGSRCSTTTTLRP